MKKLLIFICCCIYCFSNVFAQDTLWTIDGHKIAISNYFIDFDYSELNFQTLAGKQKSIALDNAFCIKNNSSEKFVYPFDSETDSTVTIYDLRQYISGAQLANEKYKANGYFVGGIIAGACGFITLRACDSDEIWGLLTPALYIAAVEFAIPTKNVHKRYSIDSNNQMQLDGFNDASRRIRFKKSLIGSGIGILGGFAACCFINN